MRDGPEDPALVSRILAKKRKHLFDLLAARHVASYNLVNVRLCNVHDWTVRLDMAIKRKKPETAKKAEFKGFFNFEMDVEQKAECKAWIRNDEEVAIAISDAVASQYKLTISMDSRSGGYQATMQAYDPKDVNAGLCMSAYAKHWYDALGVLMYKHVIILGKDWNAAEETVPEEDFG